MVLYFFYPVVVLDLFDYADKKSNQKKEHNEISFKTIINKQKEI